MHIPTGTEENHTRLFQIHFGRNLYPICNWPAEFVHKDTHSYTTDDIETAGCLLQFWNLLEQIRSWESAVSEHEKFLSFRTLKGAFKNADRKEMLSEKIWNAES